MMYLGSLLAVNPASIQSTEHSNAPRLLFSSSFMRLSIAAAVEGGFDGVLDDTNVETDKFYLQICVHGTFSFANICTRQLFFVILQAKWNDLWIHIDSGNRITDCQGR